MEPDRDPYEVLGVPRDASDGEVKEAYREKAKKYHPDASDREDAAEVFKRVKEAYEAIQTEERDGERGSGRTTSRPSSSTSPSAGGRAGADTEREGDRGEGSEARTGANAWKGDGPDGTQGGFGAEARETRWGSEPGDGFGWGYETAGGGSRGRDEGGDGGWEERGFGDTDDERGGDEDADEEGEADGDPEEFEVCDELGLGWKLGKTETGNWFVFTEAETAPYVEGRQMLYLGTDGRMSNDAVYFGTREEAEEIYEENYGEDGGFEHDHSREREESHRGFSPDGESYAHRTEEKEDGFEDDGWTDRREDARFDELWRLYYQERKSRGGAGAETRKRWGVTTDVAGDDRFVNPSGEYQEVEFWFGEKSEAVRAYERYVKKTRAAHEGFETHTGGRSASAGMASDEEPYEETFAVRTASRGYFLFEDVYDATEPIREHPITTAAVLATVVALSAHLFAPFRGLLVALLLPVYVGFVTVVQTPYLVFFVFAYAAIVTAILMVHISIRY